MQIIYSTSAHGKVGEVREHSCGMVHVYLDASYWPDRIRDEKKGLQFMGEFHSFESFKINGSYDDLTLIDQSNYIDEYGVYGGLVFMKSSMVVGRVDDGHEQHYDLPRLWNSQKVGRALRPTVTSSDDMKAASQRVMERFRNEN